MKAVLDVGHIGLKINGCVLGSVKLEGKAGLLMGSPDHSLRFCICEVNLLTPLTLLKLLTCRESSFVHISVVAEPGLRDGSIDHYLGRDVCGGLRMFEFCQQMFSFRSSFPFCSYAGDWFNSKPQKTLMNAS